MINTLYEFVMEYTITFGATCDKRGCEIRNCCIIEEK